MIYVGSAAIVKLVHAEAETQACARDRVDQFGPGQTSSRRDRWHATPPEAVSRLHPVLDLIELVELDAGIRILAQTVKLVTVRSLDAIHLATALRIRSQLTSFITYDKRLADAAQAVRSDVESELDVASPIKVVGGSQSECCTRLL
jgi:hypothetical protein